MSWLEDYWALFAKQKLESTDFLILQNANLPILEVNAGYLKKLESLDVLKLELERLQRPVFIVNPESLGKPEYQGLILEWNGTQNPDIYIEQVSWTQAKQLAVVWCKQHNALEWQELVTLEITKAMQAHKDLIAYVAFEQDKPISMILAMPFSGCWHQQQLFSSQTQGAVSGWWAGKPDIAAALFSRVATDFAGLEVSVPQVFLHQVRVLEKFKISHFVS